MIIYGMLIFVIIGAALMLWVKPLRLPSKSGKPSAQSFIGIEDIKQGIISLPGNRFRLMIEVTGTVNFALLSEDEQDRAEASFCSLLNSFSQAPVQLYVQTRPLDIRQYVADIQGGLADLPARLQEYGRRFAEYAITWSRGYNILTCRRYIIISYDGEPDETFEDGAQELWRQEAVLEAELRKWVDCRVLDTEAALDLLHTFYNKKKTAANDIRQAAQNDYLAPLVRGVSLADVRAIAASEN